MADRYTITVTNKSSNPQNYALFNKEPQVTGTVQEKIWSNVFATKKAAPGQQVTFEIINEYHAIVGQKQQNDSKTFSVTVAGTTPVTLGKENDNGTVTPGTTLSMIVEDETPQFESDPLPSSSQPHAFEIRTGSFSNTKAKKEGYMIGLGPAKSGGAIAGPAATFIPEANSTYQIQPVNTYYVTFGSYTKGDLIDVVKIATKTATVDFTKDSDYRINHTDSGALVIQV
ncbi:hypothetical protein B0T14DRAFT_561660 [Immersiella caudata]|uniref:Uncharacterized protein n=1 Tax=Immersiella caudata TaxID=314043 RepID=A0AA40CD77_9PEZI|nr:hypothetical protein B0T14DRAFT_561660 [Immersiella caudata]